MTISIDKEVVATACSENYNISKDEARVRLYEGYFSQKEILESLTYFIRYKGGSLV